MLSTFLRTRSSRIGRAWFVGRWGAEARSSSRSVGQSRGGSAIIVSSACWARARESTMRSRGDGSTSPRSTCSVREELQPCSYTISGEDEYRLRLLDDLIGGKHGLVPRRWERIEALRDNARQIIDATRKLSRRDELIQRLRVIAHGLSLYEQVGMADKLRVVTDPRTGGPQLRVATEALARVRGTWTETRNGMSDELVRVAEPLRAGRSSQRVILVEAAAALDGLVRGLTRLGKEVDAALEGTTEPFRPSTIAGGRRPNRLKES
jgi:hypothetical protein